MKKTLLLFLIAGFITGCGDTEKKAGQGFLSVDLADDPFPSDLIDSANVIVSEIKIRGADSTLILTQIPQEINLLDLRNGVTANLVSLEIPVNTYDRISLIISRAWIKMKDGTEYSLKIPSGAQTGLKINIDPAIAVESGLTSDLLLDFDVNKSFVVQGNINTPAGIKGFIFKPVLRAQNLSFAGGLSGIVFDTLSQTLGNVLVWLEQDSVISFTLSDTINGAFTILGLPAGIYSLKAAKTGYDTSSVANIGIEIANNTVQNLILTPK